MRFRAALVLWFTAFPLAYGNGAQDDPLIDSLRVGQQWIVSGRLDAAEAQLREIIRSAPDDPRAYNLLGVIQVQQADPAAAERSFRQALERDPDFSGALLNLGRLYQEQSATVEGALDKGIAVYLHALRVTPANLDARFQVALLLHLKEEYSASQGQLDQMPEATRSQPRAALLSAGNLAARGELGPAARALAHAWGGPLDEVDILQVLPAFQVAGGEGLAIDLLERFSRQRVTSVIFREQLGLLYAAQGDYEKARILLESLSGEYPDLPKLLVEMASVSFRAQQFEQALSYLAHARDLKPLDGRIHLFFGITCSEMGLGLEAMKSLEQAVSLEPENPYYNYALGAAVLHWRDPGEAIPYFEKYRAVRPDDIRGTTALAQARFLNKEYDQARAGFEKVLDDPRTAPTGHYYLGIIARLEQRFDEAVAHLEANLAAYPGNPDALAELGAIYTREGDFKQAEQVLEEAIARQADHYQANFNLLTLFARTRDARYEAQKSKFDRIKEGRWNELTESLRTIEVVPQAVFLGTNDARGKP